MSALTDYLLAIGGCVRLYGLTEASGSATIADISPSAVAGTPVNGATSQNALGATGFVTGHATCLAGGATNTGWVIGAAADATLQLQTYTLGAFIMRQSGTTATQYILGRQNGWRISTAVTSFHKAFFATGISGEPNRTGNSTNTSASVGHLIGGSYDGQRSQPWLDGQREGSYDRLVGTLGSFPNRVVLNGDTGMANANHLISVTFIFSGPAREALGLPTVLTPGEWAEIYRLGLGNPTADQQAADFAADGTAFIAATAESERCMVCGRRRRVAEGGVKLTSPTRHWHHSCFGGQGSWMTSALAVSSGNSALEVDVHHSRLIDGVLDTYLSRPTTDAVYYQRTDGKLMGLSYTLMSANYGGILAALGHMHRRWGGGKYSYYLQRMKLIMSYLRSVQIPGTPAPGTGVGYFSDDGTVSTQWGGNNDFTLREMLPGIIAVWDDLDATTRALWLDTMRKAGYGLQGQQPTNYYANGNVETNIWAIYLMLAKLDPSGPWAGYATAQLNHIVKPTTGSTPAATGLTTCGLKQFVDGTYANDPFITLATMRGLSESTGKAYFTEANGAGDKGLDWNYGNAQCGIAAAAYLVTGNTDARRFANLHGNLYMPRMNLTSGTVTGPSGNSVQAWYADFYGGTRHNTAEYQGMPNARLLNRMGRTDLMTNAQLASHLPVDEADARLNTTQQAVWYRSVGIYGLMLATSPYWPGYPEIS